MGEPENKPEISKKPPRKGQFIKNDPRIKLGHGLAGRKKTPPEWKEMAEEMRLTIVRLLALEKNALQDLLKANPTGVEMVAAKYIHEHPIETVNRFLGKSPDIVKAELTGADGKPLIPDSEAFKALTTQQLLALIELTNQKTPEMPK